MSIFSTPQKSGAPPQIPPLTSLKTNGKPNERPETIQAEIARVLRLPQSEWLAEVKDLRNETLVFLVRQTRRADQEVYGRLFQELSKRIVHLARRKVQGLDRIAAEDIVLKAEIGIVELILAENPSPASDFLEIAFA